MIVSRFASNATRRYVAAAPEHGVSEPKILAPCFLRQLRSAGLTAARDKSWITNGAVLRRSIQKLDAANKCAEGVELR